MGTNIIFAGVGGQGLILTTRIVAEAASLSGLEVSGSDVYGLAQRGGSIWGMVRIENGYFSPLIPRGWADILVGLEELEGLRWAGHLRPGGLVIVNQYQVYPTSVLLEEEDYPHDAWKALEEKGHEVISVDGPGLARELGNQHLANTIVLAALAKRLEIPQEHWLEAIAANVPQKTVDLNLKAFQLSI